MANAVADALRDYEIDVKESGPFNPTWVMEALNKSRRSENR
jgi:hypothetical protein